MGAPIKINKDLLVIAPNYTKKWLAEGQPKVSGPLFLSCTPFCSLHPPSMEDLTEWDCRDAPPSPPETETKASPAQGCLIPPLSYQQSFFNDYYTTDTHK